MAVNCATPFDEFMNSVSSKFQKDVNGLALKFEDEDGVLVTLRDESDYDLAIETAKEISRGRINGRLAVWCADA